MLNLTATTDTLQLVTGAGSLVDVHASWMDYNGTTVTPGRTNTAITGAATTTIIPAPAASTQRNIRTCYIRNRHSSADCLVSVVFNQNGTQFELYEELLKAGEELQHVEGGQFLVSPTRSPEFTLTNQATTSQALGTSDVYLAGSFIVFPRAPKVGTRYSVRFDSVKTGAGTATPIISVRFGTSGTTGDTVRNTLTLAAQTGVIDTAVFIVEVMIRSAGVAGVAQAFCAMTHVLDATGYSTGGGAVQATSGSFDMTVAGLGIGVSFNGGTLHAGTLQYLAADLING